MEDDNRIMNWGVTGASLLALGVMIGAFGAHGLRGHVPDDLMRTYETGVLYHFIHAFGILVVSILVRIGALAASRGNWVAGLMGAGVLLFSGSLYALAITRVLMLGAITPFGGLAFIAAWMLLAFSLLGSNKTL